MNRIAFKQILQRYIDGQSGEEEKRLVEQWYDLLDHDTDLLPQTAAEWDALENKIWQRIQAKNKGEIFNVSSEKTVWQNAWFKYGFAASIALVLGFSVYFFEIKKNDALLTSQNSKGLIEKSNETDKELTFELEDGSKITLEPSSRVCFPEHFPKEKREVFLTGEAFFNIAKNPQKPFLVHSEKIVTKVLGTSFWIKPNKISKAVEVEVVAGKVSVYEKTANLITEKITNSGNGVILTPNQKVTYFTENSHFVTGLIEKPILLTTKTEAKKTINFEFDDAPLVEVLKSLQESYGIEIVTEKDILNNCPITANLNGLPFFTRLDLICQALHATYEVKGTSVLISGKGCE